MFVEGSQLLNDAIGQGVIDTVLHPWGDAQVRNAMSLFAPSAPHYIDPENPNTFSLAAHARSQRWQEQNFPPITHADPAQYWAVEVARIVIPKGEFGMLELIEQVLYDSGGNYYATSVDYWGSPYSVQTDISNCRWYLKLDFFDGTQPPRFIMQQAGIIGYNAMPGYPFPELREIDGLWYAEKSPGSRVRMPLPDERMLRFYFWTPPTINYQWVSAGRLRARQQTTYCREAAYNARID